MQRSKGCSCLARPPLSHAFTFRSGPYPGGNYNLLPNSPAIDRIPPELLAHVLVDRNGRIRWVGGGIDIGAFEGFTVVPEPALIAPLLAGGMLLLRRRTRR